MNWGKIKTLFKTYRDMQQIRYEDCVACGANSSVSCLRRVTCWYQHGRAIANTSGSSTITAVLTISTSTSGCALSVSNPVIWH